MKQSRTGSLEKKTGKQILLKKCRAQKIKIKKEHQTNVISVYKGSIFVSNFHRSFCAKTRGKFRSRTDLCNMNFEP